MKRVRQSFDELVATLMPVEATWLDHHAECVIKTLKTISCTTPDETLLKELLNNDFHVGMTVIRLFLDLSKDEFGMKLKASFPDKGGIGINRFRKEPEKFLAAFIEMGVLEKIKAAFSRELHWSDVFIERLKGGRGSAIKGQQRGRGMEDFVEEVLKGVFPSELIVPRCRFTGANGLSTEKADFAIPSAGDPSILIEVKAYGATGSKQTDVLGDISRIVEQKRDDTVFILFTDGVSWKERPNDLKKLIALQNEGRIRKIYTKAMEKEFAEDLKSLKVAFGL